MSLQTKSDRLGILKNLPPGTRRVKVKDITGKEMYKKPEEVDVENDLIQFSKSGDVIVMKGKPGGQNKLPPVNANAAAVSQARDLHISYNKVVHSARKNPEGDAVYEAIMKSMAADVASLEFEIEEQVRKGLNPTQTVAKKSRVLKSMADAWLARKKISRDSTVDMESDQFGALFSLILSTMKDCMVDAGTRKEHIETIFNKFSDTISKPAWQSEAKKLSEGS
jgi:hypothetical protein